MKAIASRTSKQSLKLTLAIASALTSSSLMAESFDLQLSNSSVYAKASSSENAPVQVSGGYLYHEASRNIFNLDFHAQNNSSLRGNDTRTGLGLKAIGYHEHDVDGLGLALGGFGEVDLNKVPGLTLGGSLHYAPNILTFSDTDDFLWLEAYSAYSVMPNADVQLGYRYIKADIDGGKNGSLESTAFLGLSFKF